MNGNLMVSKSLYSTGLNTTEMMLISQIREFERNGSECFVTNQQFADWFGVSTKTIERTLDKLEENNYIKRETKTVNTNGKKSKVRKIKIVEGTVKMTQPCDDSEGDEGTVKMTVASDGRYRQNVHKVPSICPEGNVNLSKRYRQNDAIKEKIKRKEKIKEKITEEATLLPPVTASPIGTASASPSPTGASSTLILAQTKAIELHTQNKYKKWKEIIEEIKSEFNVTFEINDLRKIFNDEELQKQIRAQSDKVKDQQKQDKVIQRKLNGLDDLMSALNNRGVSASREEVASKCKEFCLSNRPDKYKWSCKDLIEIVKSKYSELDSTFDSVIKEFIKIKNNYA